MSESDESGPGGVLSSLPTTRPQRRSPKRGAGASGVDAAVGPPTPPAAKPGAEPEPQQSKPAKPRPKTRAASAGGAQAAGKPKAAAAAARPRPGPDSRPRPRPGPKPSSVGAAGIAERAPMAAQGYEPGTAEGSVEPPSRGDLIGSVAQGAGDLVHVGLAVARQLVSSVLGRLPGR